MFQYKYRFFLKPRPDASDFFNRGPLGIEVLTRLNLRLFYFQISKNRKVRSLLIIIIYLCICVVFGFGHLGWSDNVFPRHHRLFLLHSGVRTRVSLVAARKRSFQRRWSIQRRTSSEQIIIVECLLFYNLTQKKKE